MISTQGSSCSGEYSMSCGENSAEGILSLSRTVPAPWRASARQTVVLPLAGSPAMITIIRAQDTAGKRWFGLVQLEKFAVVAGLDSAAGCSASACACFQSLYRPETAI